MKTGGSAFPALNFAFPALNFVVPKNLSDEGVQRLGETQGMSLRDYFAAKAMQGILAGPCAAPFLRDGVPVKEWGDVPQQAYEIADIMLAEREK